MHRLYETDDIAVFWDSDKCRHERKCRDTSPETFNPMRRPWIDVNAAPTAEVWKAVSACPSGALTCAYTHNICVKLNKEEYRSVAYDGDSKVGECDYSVTSDAFEIYHTEVLPQYGGKGIARRLVYKIVEAAEREGYAIIPTCSYAAKVLGS